MFNSIIGSSLTSMSFIACTGVAVILGIGIAIVSQYRSKSTKGYAVTLAILPAIVEIVIMMVNGNIGAGVAVAGAFSLVRFRSAPGTAREIGSLFLAMALGLACGMGHIGIAILAFIVVSSLTLVLTKLDFGNSGKNERFLKITIPENLDYDHIFDDLLLKYTSEYELERVKTTNMGTLYELEYIVELKNKIKTKEFIDDLRVRNGNLNISLGRILDSGNL